MAGKREFLRDHKFTALDFVIWCATTILIGLPMFYTTLWLMAPFVGPGTPLDALLVLVVLALLLGACVGMSVGLALVRCRARKQGRWE